MLPEENPKESGRGEVESPTFGAEKYMKIIREQT
jgi:hypothetical protein